jgi:hypothetical protein
MNISLEDFGLYANTRAEGFVQRTSWLDPTAMSETQFGRINNLAWCFCEKARLAGRGIKARVVYAIDRSIALYAAGAFAEVAEEA